MKDNEKLRSDVAKLQSKTNARKSWELFITYFTSMLFAFTGGNVTWALVQDKLADKYHLMDKEKSLEYYALGQSLPGVLSLNAAILIGRDVAGWPGALAASLGNIVPAFFGMLIIALSYTSLSKMQFISSAISGIRAASIAIILVNAIDITGRAKSATDWMIVVFALLSTLVLKWNILIVILICGFFGAVQTAIKQKYFPR